MILLRSFLVFLFMASINVLSAQTGSSILLKINGEPFYQNDFQYAYQKDLANNPNRKQTLDQFLQSYTDLKLKITEAKALGLHEDAFFQDEAAQYINSVKTPFLEDTVSLINVARTVYDRLHENIEISQTLIPFSTTKVMPSDTLAAYKKALEVRKELVKASDLDTYFSLVRKHSAENNDAASSLLSWKTTMMCPVGVEEVMYNLPIDEISQPIRVENGYYLIRVHNRRPDRGYVSIAHILFQYPSNPTKAEKDSVKELTQKVAKDLDKGMSFAGLCYYLSTDAETRETGGELGWFDVKSGLQPTFDSIFFSLSKVEEYTQPIEFEYGYQIFKLLDKKTYPPFEKTRKELSEVILSGDRKELVKLRRLQRMEDDFKVTIDKKGYKDLMALANKSYAIDSVFFLGLEKLKDRSLVKIENKQLTFDDLYSFIISSSGTEFTMSTDIVNDKLNGLIYTECQILKEEAVMQNNLELRYLVNEYYDGILLFDILNKEVWTKSESDTEGLEATFNQNRDKYKWNSPRFKGYVIYTKTEEQKQIAESIANANPEAPDLTKKLVEALNSNSKPAVYVDRGIWAKGENDLVDNNGKDAVNGKEVVGFPYHFVVGKTLEQPQSFEDVRGAVTSDYKEIAEKRWIEDLRAKYKVELNEEVYNDLKRKYNVQ